MYQHIRSVLLCLLLGLATGVYSQISIKGKVLDASTGQPLTHASVYCENTTAMTVSNEKGEFELLLSAGGYNLIVSYTGYRSSSTQISASNEMLVISLKREDKRLAEVIVSTKSKLVADGWNSYGSYFVKNFIGATPNSEDCKLLNPEVLKFYYYGNDNMIKVLATAPLKVRNKALGYLLTYELDSFVFRFGENTCTYHGICRFSEMEGNEQQKKQWARNRKQAYEGSLLHFMRGYYSGTLPYDGWDLALQQMNDPDTFDKIKNPFDSLYYTRIKEKREVELQFPRRIRVIYTKKVPEREYLEQHSLPLNTTTLSSAVDLKEIIIIKENGYFYNPLSWVTYNYWSWKNIADMLPFDYVFK
jgi:hypothetical protein